MNMIQNAKDQVLELTLTAYQTAAAAGLLPADCPVQPSVEIPKDTANGDYTTTFCLAAAKALRKNPREVAQIRWTTWTFPAATLPPPPWRAPAF